MATCALALGLLGGLSMSTDSHAGHLHWFSAKLSTGSDSVGYRWAVGAKGPAGAPLDRICVSVSLVEPPREELEVVEAEDATYCGRLMSASDNVNSSVSSLVRNPGLTVTAGVFRPRVRRVTFVFGTGERETYLPAIPDLHNRGPRGIPVFRYLVATWEGKPCIRRVVTFDAAGDVLANDRRSCS